MHLSTYELLECNWNCELYEKPGRNQSLTSIVNCSKNDCLLNADYAIEMTVKWQHMTNAMPPAMVKEMDGAANVKWDWILTCVKLMYIEIINKMTDEE